MQLKKSLLLSLGFLAFSVISLKISTIDAKSNPNFNDVITSKPKYDGKKSYSQIRKNRYKNIWTKNMKRQYFTRVNEGSLYSKNLAYKNKFATNDAGNFNVWYADKQQKLYNKKTKNYNIYYHIKSVNTNKSGWTWRVNLTPYQDTSNKMTKYIAKQFKGTKLNEQAQYIANYAPFSHKYGGDSYYSFIHYSSFRDSIINATDFLNAPKIKEAAYPNYDKFSKSQLNNNIKLANKYYYQLINNNIKETTYFKRIINMFFIDKNKYKNNNIGIFVYPKTSKYYGSFTVIILD